MSTVDTASETTLSIRRTYPVARERVFKAWLDPDTLRRFLGPTDVSLAELDADPRIGGTYRIVMNTPNGAWTVRGTYIEIREPERIVFTWAWDEDDPAAVIESLVTLDFTERDGGTELTLTHAQLRDADSRDGHARGWTSILEKLEGVLA